MQGLRPMARRVSNLRPLACEARWGRWQCPVWSGHVVLVSRGFDGRRRGNWERAAMAQIAPVLTSFGHQCPNECHRRRRERSLRSGRPNVCFAWRVLHKADGLGSELKRGRSWQVSVRFSAAIPSRRRTRDVLHGGVPRHIDVPDFGPVCATASMESSAPGVAPSECCGGRSGNCLQ